MAKYYVAWGTTPYLVRKGGEKVFRDFMNFIQLDHNDKPISPENLGRAFYEDLIAKAILFKEFEQLYGSGINAIGQIRSSVVPYALSIIYRLSLYKKQSYFDLGAIWVAQKLPDDLSDFAKKLLTLVHEWCKTYSKSDDVGEYAKKEELWSAILKSKEFAQFEKEDCTKAIILKYKLSDADFRKRYTSSDIFDFSIINENCRIHANGVAFYNAVKIKFDDVLTLNDKRKIEELVQKIQVKHNLSEEVIEFEKHIVRGMQEINPEWFLEMQIESANLIDVISKVTTLYNKNTARIKEAFEAETVKALKKGVPEFKANGWKNIGNSLVKNEIPLITDIYKLGEFI